MSRKPFPLAACLLPMLAIAHAAAAPPQDFDVTAARTAAVADEASLDAPAKAALVAAQRTLLDQATAACATPNPDFSPFVVVMELDAAGRIVKTWRDGASPLAICVERTLRDKTLVAPPRTPFRSLLEISFEK